MGHTEITFDIATPELMHAFGLQLGKQLQAGDLLLLTGELGAGKTTLTRGIGDGMQVRGPVTSPTFVLARTHPSLIDGPRLVHVDAYRLGDSAELEDLDIDFRRSAVVAEWGAGLVAADEVALEIMITRPVGDGANTGAAADFDPENDLVMPRKLTLHPRGARWQNIDFATLFTAAEAAAQ